MAEHNSEDDSYIYPIYATVEVHRDATQKAFCDADRQAEQVEEDEDLESTFKVLEDVNFVGSSVANIIRHWWTQMCSPHSETEVETSISCRNLLLVYDNFEGFPDAMRHSLEAAIGEVLRLETMGRPDWNASLSSTSEPDKDLRGESDEPEAKGRRNDYAAQICIDAGNAGGSDQHIEEVLAFHTKKPKELETHPDWFAVIEQTSIATILVTLVYKGSGEAGYGRCPMPVDWAGEVLRWLGIRFCCWREWDELMELESPVED
ncbi:uncharacterized protein BDZ99DRAFT_566613 [Mytilinidion resinicola]|uniref:Uncharacterized protein n=1 Tax=Mytilinidion resinicola TaxID=574789 RepID=A0A6A6Z1H7_9PEZI|nr:uncharacterized protein BDZ99DRAFT_566613 [Mytilinidion resinicola]KAF2814658.1 hypothetical protein BDZ99DRAFT_566613 [Mytilinidion resinicola]